MNRRKFIATTAATSLLSTACGGENPKKASETAGPDQGVEPSKALENVGASTAEFLRPQKSKTASKDGGQIQTILPPDKVSTRTQFVVVQASNSDDGSVFTDPYEVMPKLQGSDDKPDVALKIQLKGFHLSDEITLGDKTRGVMRITASNKTATTQPQDILFWAVTTGIDLYKQSQKPQQDRAKATADLTAALSNKPIELKDGLGSFQIEILKYKEPSWWKSIFSFLSSDAGGAIMDSIGFPGIAKPALGFIDNFISKVEDAHAEALMTSDFQPFAFSERGRKKYEIDIDRIGRLNNGSWVLVKPTDVAVLSEQRPYFYATAGRLIPKGKKPNDFLAEISVDPKKDPFHGVTYAVLGASMVEHRFEVNV